MIPTEFNKLLPATFENVTVFVHENGATPVEVVLVENTTKEMMAFPFGIDVIFGFISPVTYWQDVVFQVWQKNWYEKYDKPIEDFENEGGPCVETNSHRRFS